VIGIFAYGGDNKFQLWRRKEDFVVAENIEDALKLARENIKQ
jgi:hypothetical protein